MSRSVSVVMPVLIERDWQIPMTKCAIDTLCCTTSIPFELIVVETENKFFEEREGIDKYIHIPMRGNCTKDVNVGINAATGEIIVYTGNDIFVRPDWLNALLKCFDIADCGVATLASSDLKMGQQNMIREGIYGPFMAFNAGWRFDEDTFPYCFADTDLITRIYNTGKRMYRNWEVVIHHLNRQTLTNNAPTNDFQIARQKYIDKHRDCKLHIYNILVEGWVI